MRNALVLGLLALSATPATTVWGHSHHDHEKDEVVLTDSRKEELLMKWEQEVTNPLTLVYDDDELT